MGPVRIVVVLTLFAVACNDGWRSHVTLIDQAYRAQKQRIAPPIFIDAKPPRPFRVVGYFELTSPETKDDITMNSFKAHAAATGRDLGCEVVVFADVLQSSMLAPDNPLLACGNCGPSYTGKSVNPPQTKKFYCCLYETQSSN